MKQNIFVFFILLIISNVSSHSLCILHSKWNVHQKIWIDNFQCPENILNQKYSSGSLFKIFIVYAGFYYDILNSKEIHLIQKKMYESDNEYFIKLLHKINRKRFINFLNKEINYYFNKKISSKDFESEFNYIHGGKVQFYPTEILNWFKILSLEEKPYSHLILKTILRKDLSHIYYGKSGTWNGSAWFCGIWESNNLNVACILKPYKIPHWQETKQEVFLIFSQILENNK